jgi:hypothetical protein
MMGNGEFFSWQAFRRRWSLLLATIAVALGMFAALAAGPASKAHAWTQSENFCWAWVGYYGGPNDRCYAAWPRPLQYVHGYGTYHSACVNATTYPGLALVTNWVCAATGQWAGVAFDQTRNLAGAIRNNVMNDSNYVKGIQYW